MGRLNVGLSSSLHVVLFVFTTTLTAATREHKDIPGSYITHLPESQTIVVTFTSRDGRLSANIDL